MSDLLEMDPLAEEMCGIPTLEEVEELLRDENQQGLDSTGQLGSNPDPDSPTAAVKAAIDAKISESMVSEISQSDLLSTEKSNTEAILKTSDPIPIPTPIPRATPKPLPLFPNGLPFGQPVKRGNQAGGGTGVGAGSQAVSGVDAGPSHNKSKLKTTYSAAASSPPKVRREIVENILFVYSTRTSKAPLSSQDWGLIDEHLIGMLAGQNPDSHVVVRIANSGYDKTHKCGFIACRDLESANWCKAAVLQLGGNSGSVAFRAWAKGEQPEARPCRLFFPTRFDKLDDSQLIPLLLRYNPSLQRGKLIFKYSVLV